MLADDWQAFGKAILHSFVDCFGVKINITQSQRELPKQIHKETGVTQVPT